jgi:hypothetical protein
MSALVRCSNDAHPGAHVQTPLCTDPRPRAVGERVSAWLEGKLNPKQGDPNRARCACGNALITVRGICVYCARAGGES